jgi:hypothetical protein
VRVTDIGREEFEEAHRGVLAGGSNEYREHSELIGTSWFMPTPCRQQI